MASSYTTGFSIEKMATGDQSGTWGTTSNHNWDIVDRLASYKAVALSDASTATLTVREASPGSGTENLQDGMYRAIKFTGSLSQDCTVTIAPNTAPAWFIIENAAGDDVILSQGSGANVTVQNGKNVIVYCDGAGSGAAVVDALADLQIGTLEVTGAAAIDGGVAVTGNVTATGTVEPAGDTAASDNAAIGYTSAEGLILTGQGSTNDVTIKNDADADVITIATGATNVDVVGDLTASTLNADGDTAAADNAAIGYTSAEGLILTGQGSTNDVTIKNDADADVITIATGGTNVAIAGDLTISGDDLFMATNTSGAALIADGTNFNPVVISGDATIATNGALTIADDAVTLAKMAGGTDGNIISFDASGNPVAVATGDDGQVLTSAGAGAVCAFEDAGGGATAATMQASTSGTAVDFTGIPSGTIAIDVIWSDYGCSTAGHSPTIQIGDSGGVETSGYLVVGSDSNSTGMTAYTTSFESERDPSGMNVGNYAHVTGSLRLVDPATNTWIWRALQNRNGTALGNGVGTKSLSAELDRVRFTTAGGDTLNSGKTRIIYW